MGNLFDFGAWSQRSGSASVTLSWSLTGFLPGSAWWVTREEMKDRLALAYEADENLAQSALNDENNQRRLIADSLALIANLTISVEDTKRICELSDTSCKAGGGRYLDLEAAELASQGAEIQLLNERLKLVALFCDFEAKYSYSNYFFKGGGFPRLFILLTGDYFLDDEFFPAEDFPLNSPAFGA